MKKTFLLNHQWCMIHYPEQPNGFAVFIVGDTQHFVNEDSSFLLQHTGRAKLIEELNKAGYLVYYSNLYGRNWGSERSVELSHILYHFLIRNEIINDKIHILAEGMGTLTAVKLAAKLKNSLRSLVIYSPCVSLSVHARQEQERIFYYKKWIKEMQEAYNLQDHEVESAIKSNSVINDLVELTQSLFLIHIIDHKKFEDQKPWVKEIVQKREEKKLPVKTHYILQENRDYMTEKVINFLKENEKIL